MWREKHGSWWMIQWSFNGWLSLGIHLDLVSRIEPKSHTRYGPYIDIHILMFIFSFGVRPYWSSAWEGIINAGRGGEIA